MMSEETAKVVRKIPKMLKKLEKHLIEIRQGKWLDEELKEDLYELEKINILLNKTEILANL